MRFSGIGYCFAEYKSDARRSKLFSGRRLSDWRDVAAYNRKRIGYKMSSGDTLRFTKKHASF